MALPPLPDTPSSSVRTRPRGVRRCDWPAVRSSPRAPPPTSYTDAMIGMVEEHGPYIVISPGLAFAHARPGGAVVRDGLAVVTLAAPVAFGHPHNDPVSVVLGLAVAEVGTHLESIGEIANLFNDATVTGRIAAATTADEVRAIMGVSA